MSFSRDRRASLALVEAPLPSWQRPAPTRILPFADGPRANLAVAVALAVAVVVVFAALLWQ